MRALSIRQPWAWLIVRPDIIDPEQRAAAVLARVLKDVENRDWRTEYRGPLLIHASMTMTRRYHRQATDDICAGFGIQLPAFDDLPRGGVVGVATLADCVERSASPWFEDRPGNFGFVLRDVRPLPFLACKGALSFFHVPESTVRGL